MEVSRQTLELLAILQWPRIGPAKVRDIALALRSGQSAFVVAREKLPRLSAELFHTSGELGLSEALRIVEDCKKLGVNVVSMCDPAYPLQLRSVRDAPPIIYVRGSVDALSLPGVAVVGTRKAGESGRRAAQLIANFVAKRGMSVVSGLALGIDAAAHGGAVDAKGVTVAVLAHGLDTIAPASNRPLAESLLRLGGALVSEHPPGTPPRPPEFARRNRIQSGLSLCSVIVESGAEGGAMIQANFTRLQGRPVLTVLSRGKNDLNQAGAQRLLSEFQAIGIYGTADLGVVLDRVASGKPAVSRTTPLPQVALEW